jgi:conjugal transfer ATP-binding protein TraC
MRFVDILVKLGKALLLPKEVFSSSKSLTLDNLKALLERRGVSDMLLHRYYKQISEDFGIYTDATGTDGFIIQIDPPFILTEDISSKISVLIDELPDKSVIQITTFASRNLGTQLKRFKDTHAATNCNIRNKELLDDFIDNRVKSIMKWTKESMLGEGIDFRARNFINLISVRLPKGTKLDESKNIFYKMIGSLGEYAPRNYEANELVAFYQELLKPDLDYWGNFYDGKMSLNHQFSNSGTKVNLNENGTYSIGGKNNKNKWTSKTFTTQKFPQKMNINRFQEIFHDAFGRKVQSTLPNPFLCTLTMIIDNIDKSNRKIRKKAESDNDMLAKIPYKSKQNNPNLSQRETETKAVIYKLDTGADLVLKSMWSLTIFENNENKMEQFTGAIKKEFRLAGWHIIEETFSNIGLMSMLYSTPMMYHPVVEKFSKRYSALFKSNDTTIAPLISDSKGIGGFEHVFFGRSGQFQGIDLFKSGSDNYNMVVAAPSGSGKSFFTNEWIMMSLAANYQIRIIDIGESYKSITQIAGGEFIEFTEEKETCFNFFTNIETTLAYQGLEKVEVIHEEAMGIILPIVGMMCNLSIVKSVQSAEDSLKEATISQYLEKAINQAFEIKGREAGMREVYEALISIEKIERERNRDVTMLNRVIDSLYAYGDQKGRYFKYVNGVANISLNSDLVTLELEHLKSKGQLFDIVLMLLISQVGMEIFTGDRGKRKAFIVDEAWQFLDNRIIAGFLEDLARRIRKYNGQMIVITQDVKDFSKNDQTKAIFGNSSWKVYLPQNPDEINKALNDKAITLTDFEKELMLSCKKAGNHYSEFYLRSSRTQMIGRLKVDTYSYYLFTTNADDKAMLNNLAKELNISYIQAIAVKAMSKDLGITLKEALEQYRIKYTKED